ncbi:MAG: hypothetical protein MJZ70_07585 [Bacteroidales bacterium]|nr:hypothetical protein [Bacteroidales bacterium]
MQESGDAILLGGLRAVRFTRLRGQPPYAHCVCLVLAPIAAASSRADSAIRCAASNILPVEINTVEMLAWYLFPKNDFGQIPRVPVFACVSEEIFCVTANNVRLRCDVSAFGG